MANIQTRFGRWSARGRRGLIFHRLIACLALPVTLSCASCDNPPERARSENRAKVVASDGNLELQQLTIPLLGPYQIKKAGTTPSGEEDTVYSEQPSLVTIITPEGKRIHVPSRMTFVRVTRGKVSSVVVSPMMGPSTFRDTVTTLRRLLEENNLKPDAIMQERLARLPENQPGNERYGGAGGAHMERLGNGMASPTTNVYVTINPAPIEGWFLSMSFGVIEREYWNLYPPERRPEKFREARDSEAGR